MYRILACFCEATEVSFKLTRVSVCKLPHKSKQSFLRFRFHLTYFNEVSNLLVIYTEGIYHRLSELRYHLFYAKKVKVESHHLPLCRHCLQKYIARANYQPYIWRKCLEANPEIPEPEGHGWKLDEEKLIIIHWIQLFLTQNWNSYFAVILVPVSIQHVSTL